MIRRISCRLSGHPRSAAAFTRDLESRAGVGLEAKATDKNQDFTVLATHPMFPTCDFKAVPAKYRALVPEYVKGYVSLDQFAA